LGSDPDYNPSMPNAAAAYASGNVPAPHHRMPTECDAVAAHTRQDRGRYLPGSIAGEATVVPEALGQGAVAATQC